MRTLLKMTTVGAFATVLPGVANADIDVGRPIASLCAQIPGKPLRRERLAEAFLAEAGVQTSEVAEAFKPAPNQDVALKDYGALALKVVHDGQLPGGKMNYGLRRLVQRLEERLAPTSGLTAKEVGLKATGAGSKPGWLFDPSANVALECAPGDPPKSLSTAWDEGVTRPLFSIRSTVDELRLVGDEAKEAGAFKLGYKREETEQDDGSTKTDKTLTIDGTAGIRLTKAGATAPIYLYGSYSLSEARTHPAPPLDPGKKVGDGDTDALEYGFSIASWLARAEADYSLVLDAQIAEVRDFVKDSRRLKGRLAITPGNPVTIGRLCRLGAFLPHEAGNLSFRTRCRVRGEVEVAHVFDKGTADFKKHGEFLAAGPSFGYDIAAPMGDKAAIVASATYRYLPTLTGTAPDVERLDAGVKYRIWFDNGVGLDLGLTYAKGNEPKAYKDEDKLEVGVGIVY